MDGAATGSADRYAKRSSSSLCPCPYVDSGDARCDTRFSLGRLEQAFAVCFGGFQSCPMYRLMNRERQREVLVETHKTHRSVTVTLTTDDQQRILRPTGT